MFSGAENSGTPTFPISGNSGLRCFLILVTHSCISHFTCDSLVFPCFMLLFSLMYSGLLSVPGTTLSHSLVYKYLYSVARTSELRLLLLFPFPLSDLSSPSSSLFVIHLQICVIALFFMLIFRPFSQPCHPHPRSPLSLFPCYHCSLPCFCAFQLLFDSRL